LVNNMAEITAKIDQDLKQAMIAKAVNTLSVLRMLRSAIRNKEISLRSGSDVSLADEQVLEVIASEIKKRKDSILAYEQAGRQELADQEKSEITILEKYLPAQLSDEELEAIIRSVLPEGAVASEAGKLMGAIMPQVKGKADGVRVKSALAKILAGK
jgi:uncharacterized protein